MKESLWQFALIWSSESVCQHVWGIWSVCEYACVCVYMCVCIMGVSTDSLCCSLPVVISRRWKPVCVRVCVHACVRALMCPTWACCALLDEGSGLETIGPKMSSSSLIGAAPPEPFPPPSGASERGSRREKEGVKVIETSIYGIWCSFCNTFSSFLQIVFLTFMLKHCRFCQFTVQYNLMYILHDVLCVLFFLHTVYPKMLWQHSAVCYPW